MCNCRKPWIWDEYRITGEYASFLELSLPEVLKGKAVEGNKVLVVRVPPEEDTPQHQAFVVWCKEQNIVLSGFAGSVRETTPLAA